MSKEISDLSAFTTPQLHEKKSTLAGIDVVESDGLRCGTDGVTTENIKYIPSGNHWDELYRRATFAYYPPDVPVKIWDLAREGFYYLGTKDAVKCFSCGMTVSDWILSDDPLSITWHLSTCSQAIGQDTTNVALKVDCIPYIQNSIKYYKELQKEETEANLALAPQVNDEGTRQKQGNDYKGLSDIIQQYEELNESNDESSIYSSVDNSVVGDLQNRQANELQPPPTADISNRSRPRNETINPEGNIPRKRHRSGTANGNSSTSERDDERMCDFCKKAHPSTTLLPCGHLYYCGECASSGYCEECDDEENEGKASVKQKTSQYEP